MKTHTPTTLTEVDNVATETRKAYWSNALAAVRDKVVLVEGDDDRAVLEVIMEGKDSRWSLDIKVIAAGSRKAVLGSGLLACKALGKPPHLLVDRDTWTDEEISSRQTDLIQLHITTGWCLENIFLDPDFLKEFDAPTSIAVAEHRERWVRAGAFWWSLQRTAENHNRWRKSLGGSYGSPHAKLDVRSAEELAHSFRSLIPDDIRTAANLNIEAIATTYEERLEYVLNLPEASQWSIGVHGKKAFNHLIIRTLQRLRGPGDWRQELARAVGRPPPFDALLAVLLP